MNGASGEAGQRYPPGSAFILSFPVFGWRARVVPMTLIKTQTSAGACVLFLKFL
jgi:hypothetical protein